MKWRGIVKIREARRSKASVPSVGAPMAVLSHQVSTTLSMPSCLRGALISRDPGGSPTSLLSLKGGLVVGGLGVELIFGCHSRRAAALSPDVATKAVLLPAGDVFEVQDRAMKARLGGDPAAWVQVRDADGVPLTDQIYVGRLGSGACLMDPTFASLVTAETYVSPASASARSEVDLTLTGELTFVRGVSLRIELRRREGALWWGRKPDAVLDAEILPAGHMIHFPAQPVWTGESVGPLKSLVFLDGDGDPIGNEHRLKPSVALQ